MSDVLVERARALARSLSDDLRVVGLLAELPDDGAALEAVVELASSLGRERRTLLANLAGAGSGLDAYLEAGDAEGLGAVLRGERKLGEVAVRPGTRPFLYLPAGEEPGFRRRLDSGPDDAPGRREAGAGGEDGSRLEILLERLAERIRRAEAWLLLYLPADLARTEAAAAILDGLVSLSGEPAPGAREAGLPVVGVRGPEAPVPPTEPAGAGSGPDGAVDPVIPSTPPPHEASRPEDGPKWDPPEPTGSGAVGADPDVEEGRWRRHRRPDSPPWGWIALGALAIVVLAGGWWALARNASGASGGDGPEVETAASAAAGDAVDGEDGAASGEDPSATSADAGVSPDEEPRPPADSVALAAPELTHSVLVASYARLDQARERADAWTREDDVLYFVAPTRVDGDVYHRLFSAALPSAEEARRVMERLVEMGRKDSARPWDVRPVGLAHRLAVTRDLARARELRDELTAAGVPAYLLTAVAEDDTVHQVYAGAYERAGASALEEALRETGRDAPLVTRRGAAEVP